MPDGVHSWYSGGLSSAERCDACDAVSAGSACVTYVTAANASSGWRPSRSVSTPCPSRGFLYAHHLSLTPWKMPTGLSPALDISSLVAQLAPSAHCMQRVAPASEYSPESSSPAGAWQRRQLDWPTSGW